MEKMTYVKAIDCALNGNLTDEVVEKLNALKASIAKKNTAERKPTATQKENVVIKEKIVEVLADGKARTIGEICKADESFVNLTGQKVSALVRQLVLDGTVVREEIKRKAFFSIAE